MRSIRVLLVILATIVPSQFLADEKPAVMVGGKFEVEATLDIAYYEGKNADAKKHKLNLYVPKGHKDFPVLFFIHGVAWTSGDRALYGSVGSVFAKNGIGTVVISYRLSPGIQHPEHIRDVARALPGRTRTSANTAARRIRSSSPVSQPVATSRHCSRPTRRTLRPRT